MLALERRDTGRVLAKPKAFCVLAYAHLLTTRIGGYGVQSYTTNKAGTYYVPLPLAAPRTRRRGNAEQFENSRGLTLFVTPGIGIHV